MSPDVVLFVQYHSVIQRYCVFLCERPGNEPYIGLTKRSSGLWVWQDGSNTSIYSNYTAGPSTYEMLGHLLSHSKTGSTTLHMHDIHTQNVHEQCTCTTMTMYKGTHKHVDVLQFLFQASWRTFDVARSTVHRQLGAQLHHRHQQPRVAGLQLLWCSILRLH